MVVPQRLDATTPPGAAAACERRRDFPLLFGPELPENGQAQSTQNHPTAGGFACLFISSCHPAENVAAYNTLCIVISSWNTLEFGHEPLEMATLCLRVRLKRY